MSSPSRMEATRHELFNDIIDHATQVFVDMGVSEDIADQAAISIADFLANNWGGQYVTIPKDYQFKVAKRDLEMFRFHKGDFGATARQFGMTDRGARKAIERVTKRLIAKNQCRLFED